MERPGGMYIGKIGTCLAIYNSYPDVYRMLPPDTQGAERIAHISYVAGTKKGSIDIFKIKPQK